MGEQQTTAEDRTSTNGRKTRLPLDERRGHVIEAALSEFGRGGYEGASTSSIAGRAGIQQPYIYAMFENKRELFIACNEELNRRLATVFQGVARTEDSPADRLRHMSDAYRELLEREDWARCHLQVLASAGNPDLTESVKSGFDALFAAVADISEADQPEVARFFATNVMVTAMDMIGEPPEMIDSLTDSPGPSQPSLRRTEAALRE
jgi:AcrR family transcriptional regulator